MKYQITEATLKSWLSKYNRQQVRQLLNEATEKGICISYTHCEYNDFGGLDYTFKSGKKYSL